MGTLMRLFRKAIHSERTIKAVKPKPQPKPGGSIGKIRQTVTPHEIQTGIGESRAFKKRKTRRRMQKQSRIINRGNS